MKWTYSIKNKFSASIVLFTLCLLVLLSNYLDRMYTRNVKNSIVTLYEDRLIAENYILKMTGTIYEIREVLNSDLAKDLKSKGVSKLIGDFNDWYNRYFQTKLTVSEKATAIELIVYIRNFERKLLSNDNLSADFTDKTLFSLNKLSGIQIEESKLIMKNAESQYAAIKASSQFTFAVIILILLVLQALVFSTKTLITGKQLKDPTLN